jgi:predicted site-specific integrase-resolvase
MDIYDVRNLLNSGKSIYDIPLKVVYYARVSTEKDEQIHSLQNQIEYFKEYIKSNKSMEFSFIYNFLPYSKRSWGCCKIWNLHNV